MTNGACRIDFRGSIPAVVLKEATPAAGPEVLDKQV